MGTRHVLIVLTLLSLSGCSWFSGIGDWFSDEEEEVKKDPFPLEKFKSEVELKKRWSVRAGDGSGDRFVRLVPVIAGDRIFAAGVDGRVVAFSLDKGRKIWASNIRDLFKQDNSSFLGLGGDEDETDVISAGLGISDDMLLLGTSSGEVVALNQSDGSLAWRTPVSSEVLSPPQGSRDLIIAQSIDGKVSAYDRLDGERKWVFSTSVPSLTLRGTSTPIVSNGIVICGFANGRVAAIDLQKGIARWEQKLAVSQGQSELERLVDIDGQMVIRGSHLFAASYQGRLAAMDLGTGQVRWQKDASTFSGLGEGFGQVYVSSDDSVIIAYDMETSREVWRVDALSYRGITAPVTVGNYLVVGDYDGYIHLLAQSDGRLVGRKKVDGDRLRAPVLISDGSLFVLGSSGKLTAISIR